MDRHNSIHIYDFIDYLEVNTALAEAILALPEDRYLQRSHFFNGRYENLYVDVVSLPALKPILETAMVEASVLLSIPENNLRLGFWLNIMHKDDVTTLHSHDDDDELLSAVYYVQVPAHSGLFKLHHAGAVTEIKPITGRFMFFDPALPHEVAEHRSEIPRISIGMNFGSVVSRHL